MKRQGNKYKIKEMVISVIKGERRHAPNRQINLIIGTVAIYKREKALCVRRLSWEINYGETLY